MADISVVPSAVALPEGNTETAAVASAAEPVTPKPRDHFALSSYMANDGIGISAGEMSEHFVVSFSLDSTRAYGLANQNLFGVGLSVLPLSWFEQSRAKKQALDVGARVMGDLSGSNPPLCVAGELNVRAPVVNSVLNYVMGVSVGYIPVKGDSFSIAKLGIEILIP